MIQTKIPPNTGNIGRLCMVKKLILHLIKTLGFLLYHRFFFFNDTATTEIYTLSLHDALPISAQGPGPVPAPDPVPAAQDTADASRSEEHTSELQSHHDIVCRLLLEKKKK